MVGAALGGLPAREPSQRENEGGVEQRNDQDKEDDDRRIDERERRIVNGHQRRCTEDAADEKAAAIAHEQPRPAPVPVEKPKKRAGKRRQQHDECESERVCQQYGKKQSGDQPDPRRKTVHVVQKVHRVADAGKPDHGDERVSRRQRRIDVGPREREYQKRSNRERCDELGNR